MSRVSRSQRVGGWRWRGARVVLVALMAGGASLGQPVRLTAQVAGAAQGPRSTPVDLEGELDVIFEDSDAGSRLLHFLQTRTGRIPLRFTGRPPELPTGTRVRVRGDLAEGTLSTSTVTTIVASPSRTLGQQDVLVILMNFASNPVQPYTQAAAASVNAQVRNFYLENSYGQTTMNFTVTPWMTLTADTSTCAYSTWANLADTEALARGYDRTQYDRVVYAFPSLGVCAWWGLGNVSGPRSWVNGSYALRVVAHEQGHNFGDYHSHALRCDAVGCTAVEYGDDRDVMGASGVVGHMNAFQKERLGWLNYGASPTVPTVSATDTYWVDAYATAGGGLVKGLKIWNPAANAFYYVEARTKVGFDANVAAGVTIRSGSPTSGNSVHQQDLAPTTTTWDSTLDVGQSFTDVGANVTITTLSADSSGALVQVAFGPVPCVTASPGVALSPAAQTGAPGETFRYTMTVTNRNGTGCDASPFSFSTTPPDGWSGAFSVASVPSLAPGASVSTTVSLTSPANQSGTFSVSAAALDGTSGLAGSAIGSATLIGPLSVSASAAFGTSSKSRAATVTVNVKNGASPFPGAAVTVTITKPTGATVMLSATTGSTGVATVKYSLSRKDPSGVYGVQALATASGASGSATTAFTVP